MAASEGINLISSTYSDDDDEMEDVDHREPPTGDEDFREIEVPNNNNEDDLKNSNSDERTVGSVNDDTPPISIENSTPKPPQTTRPLTPQQQQQQAQLSLSSPSPLQQPVQSEPSRSRMGRLTIVDYGHDEAAMSPEAEEGEIVGTGVVVIGAQLQTANGDIQENRHLGTAQLLTPSTQATIPQLSEQLDVSEFHPMNNAVNESEPTGIEEAVTISVEESKDIDPLDRFLPPPPRAKCSYELQERINKFLYLKRLGKSYNAEVRNKKEYRNPDFLLRAVTYQGIDQIGSCFSKDVFDPHGYDKSDYYDEIEADMKREMERKEQEKKKSQKIEFISGGSQPGGVGPAPKLNIPIPGVSTVAGGGLLPVPSTVDSVTRDGRQNKKSKWDKVDVDRRNLLPPGGKDSASAAGAHAAFLTAANAGTGYTAFAQQKRWEAEEKRSSERKMDRRS